MVTKLKSRLSVQVTSVFGWEDIGWFEDDPQGLIEARKAVRECRKQLKCNARLVRFIGQVLPVKA